MAICYISYYGWNGHAGRKGSDLQDRKEAGIGGVLGNIGLGTPFYISVIIASLVGTVYPITGFLGFVIMAGLIIPWHLF
ncbi:MULTISPECIES: hypothetical protein [Peribacillus]|uniref:Uncharacterized protein n=1 Tax=Peribacillus simplex TaxID=1478 RepID=A0A120GNV3_9BACI|nr:hypothetical protein [Peribacillus simplex]KWW16515.1 hypothetical protein AS888_24090 [Peribacillus simplex]